MPHPADSATPATAASSRQIIGQLLQHAWPNLIAHLLSMAMLVADTLIAGRYSTAELAGVAIGSSFSISLVMLLTGILQAVAPTVAHHFGAGREDEIGPTLQQGFWLAAMLALPGIWLMNHPQPLLDLASVPADVVERAERYLGATAWGLPALLFYRTFSGFNNALGRPRPLMLISAIVCLTHVPLAWTLTHGISLGNFSLAALGGAGCGISTALVNWLSLSCALAYLMRNPDYRRYRLFSCWQMPQPAILGKLLRLGLPIGLSTFIDISSFTLIAILAARLGVDTVAGHRLISNLTGLIYMLPMSLSIATMVLVGQAAGANDMARAKRTAQLALGLALTCALLIGGLLWLLREPVIDLSTNDPAVRAIALGLIAYLCLYQGFDGLQTVAAYALRGYKVTLLPMAVHTLCLWGLGLAGGYWLTFHAPWRHDGPSVTGFWEACVVATLFATLCFGGMLLGVSRNRLREATAR